MGVTEMPWPMGTLPIVDDHHWSPGSTKPGTSPGKSMPVSLPKPKRAIQSSRRCLPSRSPIVTAPMLLDLARISATFMRSVPRSSASWITRSPTRRAGGSRNEVEG